MSGSPALLHCICGGDAGAALEGGAGSGGGAGAGAGSGSGGAGAWTLCPDLDGNTQADCNETQVRNATFDFDTDSWSSPQGGIALAWEDTDAHAGERSGSLSVENLMSVDIEGSSVVGEPRSCLESRHPQALRATRGQICIASIGFGEAVSRHCFQGAFRQRAGGARGVKTSGRVLSNSP
jgi:hypothetical protein